MNDNNNNLDDDPRENRSPGEILRTAREKRQLSQQEIAQSLRLGIDVIKALDQDAFDKLSAPIFVRGYIRSYSALVGISGDEVVGIYNQQIRMLTPSQSEEPQLNVPVRQKNTIRTSWLLGVLAIVVISLVLLWLYNTDVLAPVEKQAAPVTETSSDAAPVLSLPESEHTDAQNIQATPTAQMPADNTVIEQKSGTQINPAPVTMLGGAPDQVQQEVAATREIPESIPGPSPVSAPEQKPATDTDTLDISFPNKSWVEIVDANGVKLVFRLVNPGENIQVSGKSPFRVLLGNAPGVRIERNGEPYDFSSHVRGNVARFQLK